MDLNSSQQADAERSSSLKNDLSSFRFSTENFVGVVIGKRGMGKTTLADTLLDRFPRSFVYDTRLRWGVDISCGNSLVVHSLKELKENYQRILKTKKIIYQPDYAGDDLETICDLLLDFPEWKDTLLVVDEVGLLCSSNHNDIPPALQRALRFSRHNRIALLFTAQRAVDISRDITAESTFIASFLNTEPRDIQNLSAHGFPAEKLANLKRYQYLATDFQSTIQSEVKKR